MSKNNPLKLQVLADKPVITKGKPAERIIEITVTAPDSLENQPRIPLNLSLVLDRSGSMHGEKLHFVKKAASHVIDLLSEQDRLSIVIYDDKVDTLLSSQFVTEKVKKAAKEKLLQVESRASTFLYGGWLQGCRKVAETANEKSFNRTLLLTDGLANMGERNIGALSIHAQELFMRGISTSCFGVGLGYDEHLLEAMANHGGGNFHFLETLNAIPHVFEREFDEIISVALRDVMVTLELPEATNAKVFADWHNKRENNKLTIFLGSLPANLERSVYVKLNGSAGTDMKITINVFGKDIEQSIHEAKASISFKAVDADQEATIEQNTDLMARFAQVDLADKANEALKLERAGDRAGSYQVMNSTLSLHKEHINPSEFERYDNLASSLKIGLDEVDRKRQHYMEYESKRGILSVRDYRLSFVHGAMLAEVEGQSVLINTGSTVSIGNKENFIFLKELYKIPQEDAGLTCGQLSIVYKTQIDVMLGMDILKNLHLIVEGKHGLIQFSQQRLRFTGVGIPLESRNSLPNCAVDIDGVGANLFLATAQKLSYVCEKLVRGRSPDGEVKDFFPGLGECTSAVYELEITIGQYQTISRFGIMPDEVQKHHQLNNHEGLLGTEVLQDQTTYLAFPDNTLTILP